MDEEWGLYSEKLTPTSFFPLDLTAVHIVKSLLNKCESITNQLIEINRERVQTLVEELKNENI
jgi:hypothetical protein